MQHGRRAGEGSERREASLGLDFERQAGIWRAELTRVGRRNWLPGTRGTVKTNESPVLIREQ